jgi:hypothetical protein
MQKTKKEGRVCYLVREFGTLTRLITTLLSIFQCLIYDRYLYFLVMDMRYSYVQHITILYITKACQIATPNRTSSNI